MVRTLELQSYSRPAPLFLDGEPEAQNLAHITLGQAWFLALSPSTLHQCPVHVGGRSGLWGAVKEGAVVCSMRPSTFQHPQKAQSCLGPRDIPTCPKPPFLERGSECQVPEGGRAMNMTLCAGLGTRGMLQHW